MSENTKIKVELSIKELEIVLSGLNELPHKQVRGVIDSLVKQVNDINAKQTETDITTSED